MPIHFYLPRDEWGFLSNFSPHGVELDNFYYPTVEHFFQAAKFVETDPAHAEAIRRARKPRDAATMGRDRGHPIRKDWEAVKEDIMRRGVRCKFRTHPEVRELLISTGDELLVERSPIDFYWGCGEDGSGLNRLGAILMEIRAELRAEPPPPPKEPRPKRRPR
ncbi:MAG: NADAR family protein [Polyangiaceae bacterium]|nr:NADAR family protein [Polyangiaceae bacterium]